MASYYKSFKPRFFALKPLNIIILFNSETVV